MSSPANQTAPILDSRRTHIFEHWKCLRLQRNPQRRERNQGYAKHPRIPQQVPSLYSTTLNPPSIPQSAPSPALPSAVEQIGSGKISSRRAHGAGEATYSRGAQGCRRLGGEYPSGRSRPQSPRASARCREEGGGGGGGGAAEGGAERRGQDAA